MFRFWFLFVILALAIAPAPALTVLDGPVMRAATCTACSGTGVCWVCHGGGTRLGGDACGICHGTGKCWYCGGRGQSIAQ